MKKAAVLLIAICTFSFSNLAIAQTGSAPSVAPTTKTNAARPTSIEDSKRKSCDAKAKKQKVSEDQYNTFIDTCMDNASTPAIKSPTPAPMATVPLASPATPPIR